MWDSSETEYKQPLQTYLQARSQDRVPGMLDAVQLPLFHVCIRTPSTAEHHARFNLNRMIQFIGIQGPISRS